MTPYEINILLHYYATSTDYEGCGEPILHQTITEFCKNGLLQASTDHRDDRNYTITDRGKAYCNALTAIPLPIQTWTIEWPK